jgi:hypothetical protein
VSRRVEKAFAAGLLALLVLLAFTAKVLEPSEEPESGSAESAQPDGRRALFLLLRELGFRAEIWTEAPGMLPRGGGLVWLARPPPGTSFALELPEPSSPPAEPPAQPTPEPGEPQPPLPSDPEPKTPAPSRAALGLRAPSHYRRFLEEGGTIVLRFDDAARKYLVKELGLEVCEDVHASRVAVAGVRRVRDHRGEELGVEVEAGGVLLPPPTGSVAEALWWGGTASAEGEDVLATMVPVGSGQLVLLGDDGFLENGALSKNDHALFAVRLAEEFARGGRVLFDEYALGRWRPRTATSLLASPNLFLATLQLGVLLLLCLWGAAWVREFPRDPPPLEAASPLLRARALAALLARAGRFDVLDRHLRAGALARIARRTRAPAGGARELGSAVAASAADLERWNRKAKEIECETS